MVELIRARTLITDNEYIENAIAMLKTLGFFDI